MEHNTRDGMHAQQCALHFKVLCMQEYNSAQTCSHSIIITHACN